LKPVRRAVGPALKQLRAIVRRPGHFQTLLKVSLPDGEAELEVDALKDGGYGVLRRPNGKGNSIVITASIAEAFLKLAGQVSGGIPEIDLIRISTALATPRKELKQLVRAAWCEAFGIEVPSDDSLSQTRRAKKVARAAYRDAMLAALSDGTEGVKRWNVQMAKHKIHKQDRDFARTQLPGALLKNIDLSLLDLHGSNFNETDLTWADLRDCNLNEASFRRADLSHASLIGARCKDADFSGADLSRANLESARCLRAKLTGANLERANLRFCDLRGTDLSGAKVEGTTFCLNEYDEHTVWPEGFQLPKSLIWKGKGDDPAVARMTAQLKATGPVDTATFLERLQQAIERARYDKALAMLKADRFKLFAQVDPDSVIGVVKSQTDPDLVYSCRLASDGRFACSTQNLNACGGLRGSLCKHLLVLIIGLTKSGELDPAVVYVWVQASRLRKPEQDKDRLSEAFLRYKGAEAGEIDWRPTETIPEDYYSL
jgi:uncharacterized protein YjbI with pentapeptide repeats